MDKEQTTIRLTVRATEELNELIRKETARRGTTVNQTMLYILNSYFKNQEV